MRKTDVSNCMDAEDLADALRLAPYASETIIAKVTPTMCLVEDRLLTDAELILRRFAEIGGEDA